MPNALNPQDSAPKRFSELKDAPLSAYETPPNGPRTAYETPPIHEALPDNVTPFPRLLPAPEQKPQNSQNTFDPSNI
jgi:hypothetical protein